MRYTCYNLIQIKCPVILTALLIATLSVTVYSDNKEISPYTVSVMFKYKHAMFVWYRLFIGLRRMQKNLLDWILFGIINLHKGAAIVTNVNPTWNGLVWLYDDLSPRRLSAFVRLSDSVTVHPAFYPKCVGAQPLWGEQPSLNYTPILCTLLWAPRYRTPYHIHVYP